MTVPFLLPGIALLAVTQDSPAEFGPAQVWELLDELVPAQMKRDSVPGAAVAVVMDGEIVFLEGYGSARLAPPTPVSAEETLFRIGSVSKVFTSLALARELERRGIAFDAPVGPHLGDLVIRVLGGPRPPLSFVHLLTHTAGFDQTGLGRQAFRPEDQLTPRQFLENRLVLVRAPGTVTCYDTYGITLAGLFFERLSGKPFALAMREQIFEPLGMQHSFVQAPESERGALALGYGLENGAHLSQPYEYYNTQPASSIDSTALDMARFMLALLGREEGEERVFSPALLEALRGPQFRNHPDLPGFTLGLWEEWHGAERAVWHGGTMLGFSTRLTLFPERGLGIFSTCNRDGETGPYPLLNDVIADELAQRLVRPAPPELAPPPPGQLDPAELDLSALAGSYAINLYCHTCADGQGWTWQPFEVRAAGKNEIEFFGTRWQARGPLEFVRRGGDPAVFRADSKGRVTHLFVGNMTYERIGEPLLEETFGPAWREHPDEPLVKRVLAYRPGTPAPALGRALDLAFPAELRARWAGKYRMGSGFQLEVAQRAEELWLVVAGREDRRLLFQGEGECRVQGNDALRIVFRGEGDAVRGLTFFDDDGTAHEVERVR